MTATITAVDDTENDAGETIEIAAGHGGDAIGTETVTIVDDDAPATGVNAVGVAGGGGRSAGATDLVVTGR